MMMRGQNIGRGLSLVHRFWEACNEDDEFGRAMGAPMGELRPIINKGRAKQFRKVRRRVKAMTGLKWRAFCDEVERRTSPRWTHFNSYLGQYFPPPHYQLGV